MLRLASLYDLPPKLHTIMMHKLDGLFGLLGPSPCNGFPTNEALFKGLQRLEQAAIQCATMKSQASVQKITKQLGLAADLADDILSESLVIFLDKIQRGEYQFQGHAPTSFLIEIARRVAQNYTRTNKGRRMDMLDDRHNDLRDDSVDNYFEKKDQIELVEQLLVKLGKPCSDLIQLKYLDGFKDEEIIAQKMTSYTSVESLKVSRSQCMKKLRQMVFAKRNA